MLCKSCSYIVLLLSWIVAPGQASAHESIIDGDSENEDTPPLPETQLVWQTVIWNFQKENAGASIYLHSKEQTMADSSCQLRILRLRKMGTRPLRFDRGQSLNQLWKGKWWKSNKRKQEWMEYNEVNGDPFLDGAEMNIMSINKTGFISSSD